MRLRAIAGLFPLLLASPALAQASADQAQLVFTVGAGFVGGQSLWQVPNQSIYESVTNVDTVDITRRLRSSIGFMFGGTYFAGDHVGLQGEALLLGLGTEDRCRTVFSSGSTRNADICSRLSGRTQSSTSVSLSGGVVYRVGGHQPVSPFARLNVGIDITEHSTIRTTSDFVDTAGTVTVTIFDDDKNTRVTPYGSLTLGLTAAVAKGYQLRLEARDNYVGVTTVTGATIRDGFIPPHAVKAKHVFSLMIGFDVVLERRRGRRY